MVQHSSIDHTGIPGVGGDVATDTIWNAAGDLAVGTGADTAARLAIGSNGTVLTSNGTTATWATPTGGGSVDRVFDAFGSPTSEQAFDTGTPGGTATSTPAAVDATDTATHPDQYSVGLSSAGGDTAYGRYWTPPSTPFTAICQVIGMSITVTDWRRFATLTMNESSSGKVLTLSFGRMNSSNGFSREAYTAPGTWSSQTALLAYGLAISTPFYMAMRANSGSSVDMLFSPDGGVWTILASAINPGFTIAGIGLSTNMKLATYGWLRFWDSALTFPGV